MDTVYATVGRKPALLRELVETAISGIRPGGAGANNATTSPGCTPPARQGTAAHHLRPGDHRRSSSGWPRSSWRCATPRAPTAMRGTVGRDLATPGRQHAPAGRGSARDRRPADDLTDDQVADIIWSMNAAEYWALLVRERSWTPDAIRGVAHRRLDPPAPGPAR